jgi:heterodisulfide reductase subunit D
MSTKKDNLAKQFNAVESCMGCGDCGYSVRPAVGVNLVCPVKEVHPSGFEPIFSRGKMNIAKGLLEGDLEYSPELAELVYQCTECGACHEVCHQTKNPNIELFVTRWIDHVKVWEAMRQDLVENGCAPLPEHARLIADLKDEGMRNPYGESIATRKNWVNDAPNANHVQAESDLRFFAGCTGPYRNSAPLKSFLMLADTAGTDLSISDNEWCCGSVALRIGDVETAKELAMHNVDDWQSAGIKTIVTNCAGCYRSFVKDYPELLGPEAKLPQVLHTSEFTNNLVKEGKISFKDATQGPVTYHDPCHLGRHAKVYDPPRELINAVPNANLIEMPHNRENAWCCGAGGGLKSQFPQLAADIGSTRIAEFLKTDATRLVTTCPFCLTNLQEALGRVESPEGAHPQVLDLMEYLSQNLNV